MIRRASALFVALLLTVLFVSDATAAPDPAAPAEDPAPPACDKAAVTKMKTANLAALKELILKQYVQAATKAETAITLAGKLGCEKHSVVAWSYLLRGAAEHKSGRVRRAYVDWQRALELNPRVFIPPQISDRDLHREFSVVERQMRKRTGPGKVPGTGHGKQCLEDTECQMGYVCHLGRCTHPRLAGRSARTGRSTRRTGTAAAPRRTRRFTDRGSFELMGSFGFSYQDTKTEDTGVEIISVELAAYFGYFVVRGFSLGLYAGVPFTRSRPHGGSSDDVVKSTGFDLAAAPGLAFALSGRVFLYFTALVGLAVYNEDYGLDKTNGVLGLFGGEAGLKLRLGDSTLLTFGLRPTYSIGKLKTETSLGDDKADFGSLRIYLFVGFSYFGL